MQGQAIQFRFVGAVGILLFAACGRAPEAAPAPRGEVIAYLQPGEALSASRLVGAGCVQVVQKPDGLVAADFSPEGCPADEKTLLSTVSFSLEVESQDGGVWILRHAGTAVGEASVPQAVEGRGLPVGYFQHLCQISDPSAKPAFYSELCKLEFGPSFKALTLATLEDLARRNLEEKSIVAAEVNQAKQRSTALDASLTVLRRELEKEQQENQSALEALEEAQRGVRELPASEMTARRKLERERAQAELTAASQGMKYIEVSIRFAKRNQRLAALLRKRLEDSEMAKQREPELNRQLGLYANNRALVNTPEHKSFQIIVNNNQELILTDAERAQLEEEATFATNEGQKVDALELEREAALKLFIQKGEELRKIEGLPQMEEPTEAEADPVPKP